MLDDAVVAYNDDCGHEPTDEDLQELGIDSDDNTTGDGELPEFMQ
jgi:hypothetical protein